MTFANDPSDPANMTPEERVAEVATILAEGVLRLHRPRNRAAVPVVTSRSVPKHVWLRFSVETNVPQPYEVKWQVEHHARRVVFQMAEVAIPRTLFAAILRRIERLRLLVPTPT